ncbi:maternal effect embryo arrest 22 [Raphanus sativus]|nr:maternal effect embryo arrest 22 [Raphanus sativus]
MVANAPPPELLPSGNSCCLAWQEKYLGMKKRRDACKEAIQILQKAMGAANDETSILQNKLTEMADKRQAKENDSVAKASLEKEIFELKSEIFSLQQRLERTFKKKSDQVQFIQSSSVEKEISELKNLLKKETLRADNSEERGNRFVKN